eukprot:5214895-Amphidinium_carterae.1
MAEMELTAWASLWQDADGWQPPSDCILSQRITGKQLQYIVQCCPPDKVVGADGWSMREWKALPLEAWVHMASFLNAVE